MFAVSNDGLALFFSDLKSDREAGMKAVSNKVIICFFVRDLFANQLGELHAKIAQFVRHFQYYERKIAST